jgi:hypothetical protein
MSLVDVPEMPGLSIQANNLLHRLHLELLPLIAVASVGGRRWQDQHPRLDLEFMAVPQFLFFGVESFVDVLWNHLFHANQAG